MCTTNCCYICYFIVLYFLQSYVRYISFVPIEGLLKVASLPHKGWIRFTYSILSRLHLWDYTRYVVVIHFVAGLWATGKCGFSQSYHAKYDLFLCCVIIHNLLIWIVLFPATERFLLPISICMLLTAPGSLKNVKFVGMWFQKNMQKNISWALMLR